jgi:hypothetical protein
VSSTTFARNELGSDVFFPSKEEYESGLSARESIPNVQYRGSPDHIKYLLAGKHFSFIPSSSKEDTFSSPAALTVSGLSNDSTSSSATTVKIVDNLDSNHPAWLENVRDAAKTLTLPVIASIDFNWQRFEELLSTRLLSSNFKFSSQDTATALHAIFRACMPNCSQPTPATIPTLPMDGSSSDSDSSSVSSCKLADSWVTGHNTVRAQFQNSAYTPSSKLQRENFLSTPRQTPLTENELTTLTHSMSETSSIIQLLSPIEKNRPELEHYTPSDIHEFLSQYHDYHRLRGHFTMAECLSAQQLNRIYHPATPPASPSDDEVQQRLVKFLPVRNHAQVKEYFHSKVAMRYPKHLKNRDQYDISNFQDSDFWKYYDRFLRFLDQYRLYWATLHPKSAFKQQRRLFISGAKPPPFAEMLEDRCETLETLDDIRDAVLDATTFAQNTRMAKNRPNRHRRNENSSKYPTETSQKPSGDFALSKNTNSPPDRRSVRSVKASVADRDISPHSEVSILDTGSSVHTVPSSSLLIPSSISSELTEFDLVAANDSTIPVELKGQRLLNEHLKLSDTFVTPTISQGIVSPQLLMRENNSSMLLTNDKAYLFPNSVVFDTLIDPIINHDHTSLLACVNPTNDLYTVTNSILPKPVNTIRRYATANFSNIADAVNFWHCALGHPDADLMINFFSSNPTLLTRYNSLTPANIRKYFPKTCPDCPLGNLQDRHPPAVPVLDDTPGSTFEIDFKGKWTDKFGQPVKTFQGQLYTLTAVDSATGFVFSRLVKSRLSVVDHLEALRRFVAASDKTLRYIRTDNEFVTKLSRAWAASNNIIFQPSIPFEHNTVRQVERMHRTLQEMVVKSMANKPHLSPQFWGLAYLHCSHLHNLLPLRSSTTSPYSLWWKKPYDFHSFPILPFGSVVMGNIPLPQQTTLSGRAIENVYVGCSDLHAGAVKLFNLQTKRITIRHSFKYLSDVEPTSTTFIIPVEDAQVAAEDLPQPNIFSKSDVSLMPDNDEFTFIPVTKATTAAKYRFAFAFLNHSFTDKSSDTQYMIHDIVKLSTPLIANAYCFRYYSTKEFTSPPSNDSDFEYESIDEFLLDGNYTLPPNIAKRPPAKVRKIQMLKAKSKYSVPNDPMSIKQALAHPCASEFMEAFAAEIQSLKDMNTFTEYLGDPKEIAKGSLLSSKAIFTMVYNPDGSFKKYKARLVARGDMLQNIYDPDTYAGTVRSDTLRLFFSVAATLDLDLVAHDIKTAFLYPSLKDGEDIFLRRPAGATDEVMPPIVKLLKCLYGLPQASKYFDEHMSNTLLQMGFTRCISDDQMFILRKNDDYVYLLKHVDDCMLAAPKNSPLLHFVSSELSKTYTMTTDLNPTNFVGLAITRDRFAHKITLSQPHYINTVLERFQIEPSTPSYPMSEDFLTSMPNHTNDELLSPFHQKLFQEKVGSILYLASQSRPDLLYATTQLSRRSNKCTARDMKAADRLLSYISITSALGLTLGSGSIDWELHALVDASYNCYSDSKSHTGISLHLGSDSGAFLVLSKKQSVTADSSTVAEYIASHTACQKILWAKNLLTELGCLPKVFLHQDNTSTINLLKHNGNSGRTKHIALRYNMIRETIRDHNITIIYTPTTEMTADILTKPLGFNLFTIHQNKLLCM